MVGQIVHFLWKSDKWRENDHAKKIRKSVLIPRVRFVGGLPFDRTFLCILATHSSFLLCTKRCAICTFRISQYIAQKTSGHLVDCCWGGFILLDHQTLPIYICTRKIMAYENEFSLRKWNPSSGLRFIRTNLANDPLVPPCFMDAIESSGGEEPVFPRLFQPRRTVYIVEL